MKPTNTLTIYPLMCQQQAQDISTMLAAIDEFGATALGLTASNPQGYSAFIETRDQIRKLFEETLSNYRLVTE